MKIAACMDASGAVAPLQRGTRLELYERTQDKHWTLRRTIPFDISREGSLSTLKHRLHGALNALEDCRVLLLAEARGIACAILQEEFGVRTWVSQGPLQTQLDGVAHREADLARKPPPPPPASSGCGGGCGGGSNRRASACSPSGDPAVIVEPDRVGAAQDGLWRFDLAAVLGSDPGLNSFDVLLPVLERGGFRRLEVVCDHLPRWLLPMSKSLGLRVQVDEVEPVSSGTTGRLRAVLDHDAEAGPTMPVTLARSAGCGCGG